LSDSSIAHDGAHRIKQTSGYQSGVVSSAIEEDFVAATDAGLSCIGRYCGDQPTRAFLASVDIVAIIGKTQFEEFKQLKGDGRSHKNA